MYKTVYALYLKYKLRKKMFMTDRQHTDIWNYRRPTSKNDKV